MTPHEQAEQWLEFSHSAEHLPEADALIRELLAALRWQPIATAPRDGSWILLRGDSGYINRPCRVHVGRWDAEYRPHNPWQTSEADCFEDDGGAPTHWMPLPGDEVSAP